MRAAWFPAVAVVALAGAVAAAVGCPARSPTTTPRAPEARAALTLRVDVWHDTICPWCRIGLHNLDTAAARFTDHNVEIIHHAFQLDPTTPAEGVDLRARLAEKYGADKLDTMFERVSKVGASYGLTFHWDKVTRTPNTLASHALIAWAPSAQRARVIEAVHRAYFEDGRDIGDADVLAGLAQEAGLDGSAARIAVTDPARLQAESDAARAASLRGVRSVPLFEIGGRTLSGAQSPEALVQAMREATRAP